MAGKVEITLFQFNPLTNTEPIFSSNWSSVELLKKNNFRCQKFTNSFKFKQF